MSGPVSALFDPEAQTAKRGQKLAEAGMLIGECYLRVLSVLEGDTAKTYRVFDGFVQKVAKKQVPRKPRGSGKKNIDRDEQLVAAHRSAPPRQIKAAIGEGSEARQARRLKAVERERERILETVIAAHRAGDQATVLKLLLGLVGKRVAAR
jgi:hypothetical protein